MLSDLAMTIVDNSFCILFRFFDIPMDILPKVRSSSEIYGLMVCFLVCE